MQPQSTADRIDAVDWLKAAAIVAVVVTHAGPILGPSSRGSADFYLRTAVTAFHVPTFILVSGYLQGRANRAMSLADLGRRLTRLLVPYAIATGLAWALGVAEVDGAPDAAFKLLTGSALHIYYYIPLATACILVSGPVSRLPHWAAPALAVALLLWLIWPPIRFYSPFSYFWTLRDPIMTYAVGLFLLGWTAAAYRTPLTRFVSAWRGWLLSAAALTIAYWFAVKSPGGHALGSGPYPRIAYTLAVAGGVACLPRIAPTPTWVVALSRWTLAIFLYHNFVLIAVEPMLQRLPSMLQTAVSTGVALAVLGAFCWLLPRVIGARAARLGFGVEA